MRRLSPTLATMLSVVVLVGSSWSQGPAWHPALRWGMPDTGRIMAYDNFVLSYDGRLRSARWVAERLTADTLRVAAGVSRKNKYKLDPRLPVEFRAEDDDYVGAGQDRGHLANSANHRADQALNDDTFYFSNLSPQLGVHFNRHYWQRLESSIRELAGGREVSRVHVFTGPLFMPRDAPPLGRPPRDNADSEYQVSYKLVGKNHVPIPTHFFKAILAVTDDGFLGRSRPKIRVWAYILPNEAIPANTDINDFNVTTDFLEHWAGFDLWSALADDIETDLESRTRSPWAPLPSN